MICFIVARGFEVTFKPVLSDPLAPHVSVLLYDEALRRLALTNATYIFTDGRSRGLVTIWTTLIVLAIQMANAHPPSHHRQ